MRRGTTAAESSAYRSIPFRMRSLEHDACLPGHPARRRSFYCRIIDAIGTIRGALDIPTIDTSCGQRHEVCFRTQAIEDFTDEQPPAALVGHRPSFCVLCHSYVTPTCGDRATWQVTMLPPCDRKRALHLLDSMPRRERAVCSQLLSVEPMMRMPPAPPLQSAAQVCIQKGA